MSAVARPVSLSLVYVAGAYSAATRVEVSANVQRARELAARVDRVPGYFAVTPHLLGLGIEDAGDDEFWYEGTAKLASRCDVLVTVVGWERSKGSRREVADAQARGIPVYHGTPDEICAQLEAAAAVESAVIDRDVALEPARSGDLGFDLGSDRWPGLGKLVEEAGEVVQVCGKIMGAEARDVHWDGSNLRVRLTEELADLAAAVRFVIKRNALAAAAWRERVVEKEGQYDRWREAQRAERLSGKT